MAQPVKVLIVEDSAADAELVLRALKRTGFEPVHERVEDEEGFRQQLGRDWDVILSDYNLPQFSGMRALELVKERNIEVPFILVSGTIGEETAVEAMRLGAADYLLKDRLTRLGPAVVHAIDQCRLQREKRQADEILRLREQALSGVSQGVLICDERRNIIYANASFTRMTGYSEAEVLGRNCSLLQGADTDPSIAQKIRASLDAEQPFEGEILNYRKGGEPFWNELSIYPYRGEEAGSALRFIGIQRDVTSRKLAQEALKRSEAHVREERALLKALIDSIPDLIFFKDKDSTFLGCNRAFEQHFNIREQELVGRTDYDLVATETADAFRELDRLLLASGASQRVEEWIPGSKMGRHFETVKTPYFGPSGKSLGMIGVSRDITERKVVEEQMRKVLERMQLAAQAGGAGIWELDLVTGEAAWDAQMFTLFGKEPSTEPQSVRSWFEHMAPEDIAACNKILEEGLLEGRATFNLEFRITRADDGRSRVIRSTGIVNRDDEGRALRFVGTNRDVTEERNRELDLAKALDQEKKLAEKAMAGDRAKSEFLAVMSHEVRTPMNGILGFAELLAQSPNLAPDCASHARTIVQSGHALLRILDDILDFSRVESGRLQIETAPFSPRKMLDSIERLLETQAAEKGLGFQIEISDLIPEMLLGDAGRLRQVLLNIAGNALKFSESGTVKIGVSLHTEKPATYVFSVTDSGPGIATNQLQQIFQPFTQADSSISRRYGGTGLGLAISKRLTELLGGELRVRSVVGIGSEFFVIVPLAEAVDMPLSSVPAPVQEAFDQSFAQRHPLRILLVEDDRINLKLVQTLVRRLGYEPAVAKNGREAVDIYREERPDFLLMDLQMPEMDGIEATENIRQIEVLAEKDKPAFICALTANIFPADRERCFTVGMNGYLNKPVKIMALAQMLAKA